MRTDDRFIGCPKRTAALTGPFPANVAIVAEPGAIMTCPKCSHEFQIPSMPRVA